jgi:alkyl hydroperoxide reductase subunit AhpC
LSGWESSDVTLQLGQIAPDFEQDTANGSIRFHQWMKGSWCILFSHPKDFAPVCMAELAEATRLKPEWTRRGIKIVALSIDSSDGLARWEKDIAQKEGLALNFPVITDADRMVSTLYGIVHPGSGPSLPARSAFLIDPSRRVRLILTYLPSVCCNFDEMLGHVDRLQQSDAGKASMPFDWKHGDTITNALGISGRLS